MGSAPSKRAQELLRALPEFGAAFDETQCKEIWAVYDVNKNGVLDELEAHKFIHDYYKARGLKRPDIQAVFKVLAQGKIQLELSDLIHPQTPAKAEETKKQPEAPVVTQPEARLAYSKDEKPPSSESKEDENLERLRETNPWEWLSRLTVTPAAKKPLIPGRWITVRVFLSSTFVDMHGERDCLIKEVFPELNMRLKDSFVRVVPVDLRWGVSAEQTNVIQSTCLDEIDHCRTEAGSMPWFLGLRGARYGWVQEKYQEPGTFASPEYLTWLRKFQDMGRKLSITSMEVYHAYVGASPTVAAQARVPRSLFLFRNPAFMKDVPDDRKWLFDFEYMSAEKKNEIPENLRQQYSFLDDAVCAGYKSDYAELDSDVKTCKIPSRWFEYPCTYKESRITGQLPNGKMFGVGSVGGLDEFRKFCIDTLSSSIRAEYPEQKALSRETLETARHASLVEDRAEGFVGREQLLDFLLSYCFSSADSPFKPRVAEAAPTVWVCGACTCENALDSKSCAVCESPAPTPSAPMWNCAMCTSENAGTESECGVCGSPAPPPAANDFAIGKIFVLVGVPGCGKSALVARLSQLCSERGNASTALLVHLVGASEDSVSLRAMLTRICYELKAKVPSIRAEIPVELDALKEQWHSVFLAQACEKTRVVLVIDAINQLLPTDDAHEMTWLPTTLPENARVILSTLEHESGTFANTKKMHGNAIVEFVGPLLKKERQDLVAGLLARYHKLLTTDNSNGFLGNQMELVMEKQDAELPLFLVLIADVLRRFGVYEKLTPYIKELPGTVNTLFQRVLQDLEDGHGVELVRASLSLLAVSRGGLMEMEMLELLELRTALELPAEQKSNFSVLHGYLQGFFASGGSGFLRFFHDQIRYTVCDKYAISKHLAFQSSAHEIRMNSVLGSYFLNIVNEKLTTDKQHQNDEHSVNEAVFHLVKGNQVAEARKLLLTMDFCYLKLLYSSVDNLLEDFDTYLRVNQERPLKLARQAIEMSRFSLTLDPKQVSLQLFAKLSVASQEYPELASMIDPKSWRLSRHPSSLLPRVWTGLRRPGGPLVGTWVCSRKCEVTDMSEPFLITFPLKPEMRVCIALTDDNLMMMWNLTTGTVVHVYKGPFQDTPKRLTFVPNTKKTKVVITGYRNTMVLYDLLNPDNSSNYACFKFPPCKDGVGPIISELLVHVPGRGFRMLTTSTKGELYVWKLPDTLQPVEPEHILEGHMGAVGFVELATGRTARNSSNLRWNWTEDSEAPIESGDGKIVSWDQAGVLRVWDLTLDKPVAQAFNAHATLLLNGKNGIIQGAIPLSQGTRLLSWDHNGYLVNSDLSNSGSYHAFKNDSHCAGLSLDEHHVLSWTKAKLYVWDLRSPDDQKPACFLGHEQSRNVRCATLVPGSPTLVASWSADKTIKIWDWTALKPGEESKSALIDLTGHTSEVKGVFFFEGGRKLLSFASDIRIWELEAKQGHCIATLNGHVGDVVGVRLTGSTLFSWAYDGKILVWDLTKSEAKEDGIHADQVMGLAALSHSVGQARVVTAAADGNVFVWQLASNSANRRALKAHSALTSLCSVGNGKQFITTGDFEVKLWDSDSLSLLHSFACPISGELQRSQANYLYTPVAQMAGNNRAVVTGLGQLCSWDLKSSEPVCFSCPETDVTEAVVLGVSHKEKTAYWWSAGVRQCSLDNSQPTTSYLVPSELKLDRAGLALSGGRVVATVNIVDKDKRAIAYWKSEKQQPKVFQTGSLVAGLVVLDPQENFVLTYTRSGSRETKEELVVWDLKNENPETNHYKLPGHEGDIGGALLLPNQQAISWGQDGLLLLWDVSDLQDAKKQRLIAELRGHPRAVKNVQLLQEQKQQGIVAVVSWSDVDVRLWHIVTKKDGQKGTTVEAVWSLFLDTSSPAFAIDFSCFPEFITAACTNGGFLAFA